MAESPVGATLAGHVVASGSNAALAGAVIHIANPKDGSIRSSSPVAADGSFRMAGVPAASYQVAVEKDGRLYVVSAPVALAPGQTRNVQLAVNPEMAPKAGSPSGGKLGVWNNPLTASLIVVGAAIVLGVAVDQLTNDNKSSTSPSN